MKDKKSEFKTRTVDIKTKMRIRHKINLEVFTTHRGEVMPEKPIRNDAEIVYLESYGTVHKFPFQELFDYKTKLAELARMYKKKDEVIIFFIMHHEQEVVTEKIDCRALDLKPICLKNKSYKLIKNGFVYPKLRNPTVKELNSSFLGADPEDQFIQGEAQYYFTVNGEHIFHYDSEKTFDPLPELEYKF